LAAGQRQSDDLLDHRAELLVQGAAVVRQPVALADRADLGGDLGVAVRRNVREHMVLDLVAEIAAQHVEQPAPAVGDWHRQVRADEFEIAVDAVWAGKHVNQG
jgi:hypothetical protein